MKLSKNYEMAIDIETIADYTKIAQLPEPDVKFGNTKDEGKRAIMVETAKTEMVEKMALSPYTGRVCAVAVYGNEGEIKESQGLTEINDKSEQELIQLAMKYINGVAGKGGIIITFNGMAFDLPYLWARAMRLRMPVNNVLSRFMVRYKNQPHSDIRMILSNWNPAAKGSLDYYGKMILGVEKNEPDYKMFIEMINTGRGKEISDACLQHTELTYRLYMEIKPYFIQLSQYNNMTTGGDF